MHLLAAHLNTNGHISVAIPYIIVFVIGVIVGRRLR